MSESDIYFKQLELGPMQNFIYLIGDPVTREAAVIDPGWEVPTILATAQQDGYRLTKAFVTHHHFDHVMGLSELLHAVDIPVYVNQHDAPLVEISSSARKPLRGGDEVTIGTLPVRLLHTPGHTPGSQCLLVRDRLLSGDTLFIGSCGRCDLPGGSPTQLYESLSQRLRQLDDQTVLCPGHHYAPEVTVLLGREKQHNPFLAATTLQRFLRLVGAA